MSERTFTLIFTDSDRLATLTALGFSSIHLSPHPERANVMDRLIDKLIKAQADNEANPRTPTNGAEVAKAILQPSTEKFARDRKGNAQTEPPKGADLKNVRILQADEDLTQAGAPILKVIFSGGKANCFDPSLWPAIKEKANVAVNLGLWIVKSGNYQNIVGVRTSA